MPMFFLFLKTSSFRSLVIALVVFAVLLGAVIVGHLNIKKRGNELIENQKLVQQQQNLVSEYNRLRTSLDSSSEQREAIKALTLHNDEHSVVEFLSYLEGVAGKIGVSFDTKTLEIVEPKGETAYLDLRLSLSGSESQVLDMLRLFEVLPYHAQIDTLALRRDRGEHTTTAEVGLHVTVTE